MSHKASRSGLFLLELIMSILFFSIAGAVCVRLFVNSHLLSRSSVELNHALEWSQNIAELFYGCNGDPVQIWDGLSLIYSADTTHFPDRNAQSDDRSPYPVSFRLLFDHDFEPIKIELSDSSGFSTADPSTDSGYLVGINLSENDGLVVCDISTQKLPLSATDKPAEPIYQLNLTLFPSKEVFNGN